MNRRLFVGACAAVGTLLLGLRYSRLTDANTIESIVYKRLGYLRLDEIGVKSFAHDFAQRHVLSSQRLRAAGFFWPIYQRIPLDRHGWTDRINFAEERIVSNYLISSDFFQNGANEAKPVHYLGYFDALSRACGNPFRQIVTT